MNPTTTAAAANTNAPVQVTTNWIIDLAHSEVGFRVRHMMVSWTRGKFERFAGTVELNEADVTKSKIDVTIEAASINTGTVDRDNHLRSADFFDAEKFPQLRFTSTSFEAEKNGHLRVLGTLEMHGISKPVTLEVEPISAAGKDPWGGMRRGTRATARLNRKDFGLNWNSALELGGVLVGDEVEITLEVELIQK